MDHTHELHRNSVRTRHGYAGHAGVMASRGVPAAGGAGVLLAVCAQARQGGTYGHARLTKSFDAQMKMGQLPVAIDPFVNLVAGTGFEPVTFGL